MSFAVFASPVTVAQTQFGLNQMVTRSQGKTTFHAKPVAEKFRNQWPAKLETEFQERAAKVIAAQTKDVKANVNTYFENEKRSYGFLMAHVLGGKSETALKYLQTQDHQHSEWHRETDGIDYYACFTLKHQMRKYFYFGDLLDPAYRKQMYSGAKKWTAKDPMRRTHYAYKNPKPGWGPDAKNSWVDVRSTENLFLMRVTSVYLMAEETGNKTTARKYKEQLLNYTRTLYRIGIGEWDSENYHGHSITPLLNLYDFAKDNEVKLAAKACLDFFATAGAIKYWRGGFNGPTKRDYNHAQPFGGSAANSLWLWFGDHPTGKLDHWESDEVHQITSAYRPPLAAVNLARKRFAKPVEIFAAKPPYDATTRFRSDARPEYHETQFIGHSFQLGTLASGTSPDGGDVNGFKILAFDEKNGAIALHAVPGSNPSFPGSPMYKQGIVSAPNRVAQQENIAIWLAKDGQSPWLWVIPADIKVIQDGKFTFLKCDRTWVGIRMLGGKSMKVDSKLTQQLLETKKNRFPNHQVLKAVGTGKSFSGMAVEIGEKESHGSFDKFRLAVKSAEIDVSEIESGIAKYKSRDGKWLGIHWHDEARRLGIWRNGKRRDLAQAALYESPIVSADWGSGRLSLDCGGEKFSCQVDGTGKVKFDP